MVRPFTQSSTSKLSESTFTVLQLSVKDEQPFGAEQIRSYVIKYFQPIDPHSDSAPTEFRRVSIVSFAWTSRKRVWESIGSY